jgi:hypothetical protein
MAELTEIEEKVAEVLGLSLAAQTTTKKVAGLLEEHPEAQQAVQKMHEESSQTEERCRAVVEKREGKKTAIEEKARETRGEAEDMMRTYLGDDADGLDGLEFMYMAEAAELGHVEVVKSMNEKVNDSDIGELVDFVFPLQEQHWSQVRELATSVAKEEAEG